MNLMDTMMDEFHEEGTISKMDDREVIAWIEVSMSSVLDEIWIREGVQIQNEFCSSYLKWKDWRLKWNSEIFCGWSVDDF